MILTPGLLGVSQRYQAALFHYFSSLYYLDFNLKDKDEFNSSEDKKREWFDLILAVLSNLSLCFLKTDDHYNTRRAANLGLWYAEKLRTAADQREVARAKLLTRRGLARFYASDQSNEDALADVTKANKLSAGSCPKNLFKQVRDAARADRSKDSFRGKLGGASPTTAAASSSSDAPAAAMQMGVEPAVVAATQKPGLPRPSSLMKPGETTYHV